MKVLRALVMFCICSAGARSVGASSPANTPPDVFLITIDTLRADHVHCYGYEHIETPTLDALARHGDRVGATLALETGPESGEAFRALLEKIDTGSLAANFDPANLLIHGHSPYEGARALRAFNDKVVNGPRVVCVLTTIRDGVTLIRRAG